MTSAPIPAQRHHAEPAEPVDSEVVFPPEMLDDACVFCMSRPALPGNGMLCGTCAPPIELRSRNQSRIRIRVHQLAA